MSESQRADVSALIEGFLLYSLMFHYKQMFYFMILMWGKTSPIMQHPYRVNPFKREVMKLKSRICYRNGLAVSSQSAWSSPCLLVPKSDGSFRFCTDYRKINAVTKPDSFPLPRIDDCIDKVGPAKFVTKLDLLKGYWQVPLTPRAARNIGLCNPGFLWSIFESWRLACGMPRQPFKRLMRLVLQDVPDCEAYLDDIVIYSATWEEHMNSLRAVFARLAKALLNCELG